MGLVNRRWRNPTEKASFIWAIFRKNYSSEVTTDRVKYPAQVMIGSRLPVRCERVPGISEQSVDKNYNLYKINFELIENHLLSISRCELQ